MGPRAISRFPFYVLRLPVDVKLRRPLKKTILASSDVVCHFRAPQTTNTRAIKGSSHSVSSQSTADPSFDRLFPTNPAGTDQASCCAVKLKTCMCQLWVMGFRKMHSWVTWKGARNWAFWANGVEPTRNSWLSIDHDDHDLSYPKSFPTGFFKRTNHGGTAARLQVAIQHLPTKCRRTLQIFQRIGGRHQDDLRRFQTSIWNGFLSGPNSALQAADHDIRIAVPHVLPTARKNVRYVACIQSQAMVADFMLQLPLWYMPPFADLYISLS